MMSSFLPVRKKLRKFSFTFLITYIKQASSWYLHQISHLLKCREWNKDYYPDLSGDYQLIFSLLILKPESPFLRRKCMPMVLTFQKKLLNILPIVSQQTFVSWKVH